MCCSLLLPAGGMYIIEDTHTAYWARHGGGYRRPGTAIQMSKSLVDGMHGWYHHVPLGRRARWAKDQIRVISFFDSMIAIEKRFRTRPIAELRGKEVPSVTGGLGPRQLQEFNTDHQPGHSTTRRFGQSVLLDLMEPRGVVGICRSTRLCPSLPCPETSCRAPPIANAASIWCASWPSNWRRS